MEKKEKKDFVSFISKKEIQEHFKENALNKENAITFFKTKTGKIFSLPAIKKYLREADLFLPDSRFAQGSKEWNSLSKEERKELVISLQKKDFSLEKISKIYGVKPSLIGYYSDKNLSKKKGVKII